MSKSIQFSIVFHLQYVVLRDNISLKQAGDWFVILYIFYNLLH